MDAEKQGAFAALAVPNFRRYVSGQSLSLIGTWVETVAQALVPASPDSQEATARPASSVRYERDRHRARPRLGDVVFCLLTGPGCLQDRHRQRCTGGERGQGDDYRDRVRASGRAGAGDAEPEEHEVPGLKSCEDFPEGQEADRLRPER
jgi:hypothetical protein